MLYVENKQIKWDHLEGKRKVPGQLLRSWTVKMSGTIAISLLSTFYLSPIHCNTHDRYFFLLEQFMLATGKLTIQDNIKYECWNIHTHFICQRCPSTVLCILNSACIFWIAVYTLGGIEENNYASTKDFLNLKLK